MKVENGVEENIDSRAARHDERTPPPVVILQRNQYKELSHVACEMKYKIQASQIVVVTFSSLARIWG